MILTEDTWDPLQGTLQNLLTYCFNPFSITKRDVASAAEKGERRFLQGLSESKVNGRKYHIEIAQVGFDSHEQCVWGENFFAHLSPPFVCSSGVLP